MEILALPVTGDPVFDFFFSLVSIIGCTVFIISACVKVLSRS